MARLDNAKRIIKEDYPTKYHDLIHQLGFVVNTFMEQATDQINGNLDFDNLSQDIVTFDIVVNGSGVPVGNNLFKTNVSLPRGFNVIRAIDKNNPGSFVTNQPFISYTPQTDTRVIRIDNLVGLVADRVYTLTVIAIP